MAGALGLALHGVDRVAEVLALGCFGGGAGEALRRLGPGVQGGQSGSGKLGGVQAGECLTQGAVVGDMNVVGERAGGQAHGRRTWRSVLWAHSMTALVVS